MITQVSNQRCVLLIIADGFEETEIIIWLSTLRQAGLCVKSVGLTSGLISGAHGVRLMPDLTFAELDHWLKTTAISLVILPDEGQSLSRMEADPRVHKLVRQVLGQGGQIATDPAGLRIPKLAAAADSEVGTPDYTYRDLVLLRDPAESWESFAQNLIQRLL